MATSFLASADDLMVRYAEYHRDRRNIATHFVGIPMIVFSIGVLLARPSFGVGDLTVTPAWIAVLLSTLWYLTRGRPVLAVSVSLANAALVALAAPLGALDTLPWLAWGIGSFVLGWIIQFVGHHYEGRKPAFADDIVGLLVGPMFVTAELLFAVGWGRSLAAEIERRAGPTRAGELRSAA